MPTPSFPPLVCPLVLALTSRNQDISSLFLSRLFTKVQPNILPPLQKNDKEGNPLPPEPRDVKEPRTLQNYDKEYVTGKMLTLLTLPCRGYASILVYNYPTADWKKQLREKLKLPEPEQEDADNFMSLLFNYYDMPTSLLLRNKRLSLLSPAQFLNFCGIDVARKLLTQKITVFNAKVDVLDSANRRLEMYSTKKYVDLSDYENKIKLATRHAICYGPKPEGTVVKKAGEEDDEEEEDEDEEFDPTKEDEEEEEQPPAIPYLKVEPIDEEKEHLIDPDVLDVSGPQLDTKYWRDLAKAAPPRLRAIYQILSCLVADDWVKLADIWEEHAKDIATVHYTLLSLLKKGEELLFAYSSMAKCNTYQLPTFEKLKEEMPESYDEESEINDALVIHYGSHIMGHFRAVVIGLATGALTMGTQDEKLPLESVLEIIYSPLYVGDVIFSSTTTMYWKSSVHMNPDYDLSLSQNLTPFTGMNIRGLTSDVNEYVLLAMRHDNVRFFTALLYMIIEINGLPARFLAEFGQEKPELKNDPRGAMAMVCEFVPDLRALLSSTSLLIMALTQHAVQCVMALVHTFPIWCWQQLATWAYTGFSPSDCMRLARAMSEAIPPVLSTFDSNTIRKLTPIFGRYVNALLENKFDPEVLNGDGEALGVVYGVYDKYTQSRKGYFTRGDGANGLTTEYNEADIHTHRTLLRDMRHYIDGEHKCPFCQAGHSDAGFEHSLECDPEFIFRLPTGLIDIAVIMGHTSVASALLLLSMALRSQFTLTETFRLFSKEVIIPEDQRELLAGVDDEDEVDDEDLFKTTNFSKLTPATSKCICHATDVNDLHSLIPKRYFPYLLIRFLCSPMLVPSFDPDLRNSMLYIHPFITASAVDNQDLLHLFSTAGFDTLTTTEVHNYAVDPLTASVGSPTTVMLRTMFTLIRQRFKRIIMILFNCARSVTSAILSTDELVFISAIANPLPIITHSFTKFPYEMFQVKPQEGAKTLPLSSRLLMFSHSNIIDYMLYKVVSTAANGVLSAFKVAEEYLLVDDYSVTPLSRREDVPFPGDDDEDGATNPEGQEEDDEETQMERIEWYAEQKRLRDEENEELQPDPLKREVTTPSMALALRTSSPWVLYALLRCLHPSYDAHGTLMHINEHIITAPELTIYSNSPFVFNDNAGIGSSSASPNAVVDDQIGTRNRDLLNAVATINKLTAAVQLHAKATGDRLGTQWSLLYNRFPVGLSVDPRFINDEVPLNEYDPKLNEEEEGREEVYHLNKEKMNELIDSEKKLMEDRQGGLFGDEGISQEEEMKQQIESRYRMLNALKYDRFEQREPMPERRSPYCAHPTSELDVERIMDHDGTPLSAYLQRAMLSTMPSRKYDEMKDKEGNVIPVQTVLLSAMLHCLNAKVYGVPSGEDNKIMTVPMIALAPRCNNIPALKNILDRGDKVLFDVFAGYGSIINADEQDEQKAMIAQKMGSHGHDPQSLRDALDELVQDDPEWGQYVNQTIDHNTRVLGESLQGALRQFQQAMGIQGGQPEEDDTSLDIF